MPEEHTIQDFSVDGFLKRSNLSVKDRDECFHFVRLIYPNLSVALPQCQGYCSLTILAGSDSIVQFRPRNYQLDLEVTKLAYHVYGSLAPETTYMATLESGLLVYRMRRIAGASLEDLRASKKSDTQSTYYLARLCKDFAAFLALSWHRRATDHLPLGVVGSSIILRLKHLSNDLPLRFQHIARQVIEDYHLIEALPWVLNHGDIVAANVIVEPSTGKLAGLVDWAEAEMLPFGTCLYGLEELLGEMTPNGFQYHQDAAELRKLFWIELNTHIPQLEDIRVLEAVKLARDLGVLLWHGIAFDNGAINRVVQEGRDINEISRLNAFLSLKYSNASEIASKM